MRGPIRAATRAIAAPSHAQQVILALAIVIQVGAGAIEQVQAGAPSPEQDAGSKIIVTAQIYAGDPANPVRIRELPGPKTNATVKPDPGNPTPTKELAPPPSTTENTPPPASDKPQ
jgi:hypothetical protein